MKEQKKDWCTWFPEYWHQWYFDGIMPKTRKIYIGDCCKIHDTGCSTGKFCKCLRDKLIVGALLITLGGAIGCWVKYPKLMKDKI